MKYNVHISLPESAKGMTQEIAGRLVALFHLVYVHYKIDVNRHFGDRSTIDQLRLTFMNLD